MFKKITVFAVMAGVISFGLNTFAAPSQNGLDHMSDQALNHIKVCNPGDSGVSAGCHARVIADKGGSPSANSAPSGYGPTQFRAAYGITTDSTKTIAIVDA